MGVSQPTANCLIEYLNVVQSLTAKKITQQFVFRVKKNPRRIVEGSIGAVCQQGFPLLDALAANSDGSKEVDCLIESLRCLLFLANSDPSPAVRGDSIEEFFLLVMINVGVIIKLLPDFVSWCLRWHSHIVAIGMVIRANKILDNQKTCLT